MNSDAYTIRVFVPNGEPEGLRILDRFSWTGMGLVFPRTLWPEVRHKFGESELGVYVLVGTPNEDVGGPKDGLLPIYVGEGEVLQRLNSHAKSEDKDFWSWTVVFRSTNRSLNKAHVEWLEARLVALADRHGRSDRRGNTPKEPPLIDSEKAELASFLNEMLRMLPLVNLHAFHPAPAIVATPFKSSKDEGDAGDASPDTILVPAKEEGFNKVFLGEDCWYSVRISGGMLERIKWIAAYRVAPESAITHIAQVKHIVPHGETGKYKLVFKAPATELPRKLGWGTGPKQSIQNIRYVRHSDLMSAKSLKALFENMPDLPGK